VIKPGLLGIGAVGGRSSLGDCRCLGETRTIINSIKKNIKVIYSPNVITTYAFIKNSKFLN
jgi:hypothetical protein